jgi:hypothetical protein
MNNFLVVQLPSLGHKNQLIIGREILVALFLFLDIIGMASYAVPLLLLLLTDAGVALKLSQGFLPSPIKQLFPELLVLLPKTALGAHSGKRRAKTDAPSGCGLIDGASA